MPRLQPGDQAPDFTLPTIDGSSFTLSKHRQNRWTVLTFYRGDACPVCNRYLHSLQQAADQFCAAGAQIVAVSADRPDLGQQTVERHQLAFPVLSDPERRAVELYDVIYNSAEGHAEPAAFVISPEGAVVYESIISGHLGRPTPDDLLMMVQMLNRQRSAVQS